ncbi:MAG: DUF3108 domain-containing protein [Acidobacteriota bacterium]|nr:DUF3108 domain-containing protein [Acidobacteriota bacterium]
MAQNAAKPQTLQPAPFRIGERLTYNISFEKFNNAAFAEIYTVSRGKLGDKNAIELRSKIKTTDLVSAAFYLLDETRTTFASAETGLPLYVRKTSNIGVLPKETISNFLVSPTANFDLLTLIYGARTFGGIGTFSLQEDDIIYRISLQTTVGEAVKTDAGEFDTTVSTANSQYFTEMGISNLRINFSVDSARIPVLIRFKTAKGEFRAEIASIQILEPIPEVEPTPAVISTPQPQLTPKLIQTPIPYIENEPLLLDLPFALGETLEYQVSMLGKYIGNVVLQAKERRQFSGQDSLLLTATGTLAEPGNAIFKPNNIIKAQVNPDSLAPQQIEFKFSGNFSTYNQTTLFDQKTGFASNNAGNPIEIPVGTHSILSLAYAIRSFNLKPSKDLNNPVNDTRVAVFLGDQAYVFTLRPANAEIINLKGEKISAQLISISAGNPQIDQLNLRLWLGNDEKRLPLRFSMGNYQADLLSETKIQPK